MWYILLEKQCIDGMLEDGQVLLRCMGISCGSLDLPGSAIYSVFVVIFTFPRTFPPCTLAVLSLKISGGQRVSDAETCCPLPI
jgi:hypothetical protein